MPGYGALPTTELSNKQPENFEFADVGGGAIAYAEGHPSEANQMITFRPNRVRNCAT